MRLSGDLVPHNWRSAFFFLSLGRCLSVKENAEITPPIIYPQRTQDFPGGSDGKMSVYDARDPGSTPGLGRSLGEEKLKTGLPYDPAILCLGII